MAVRGELRPAAVAAALERQSAEDERQAQPTAQKRVTFGEDIVHEHPAVLSTIARTMAAIGFNPWTSAAERQSSAER